MQPLSSPNIVVLQVKNMAGVRISQVRFPVETRIQMIVETIKEKHGLLTLPKLALDDTDKIRESEAYADYKITLDPQKTLADYGLKIGDIISVYLDFKHY